jgi:hypothetical protein
MPRTPVPSDATIADVLSTLEKPEEYVRGVLKNLYACASREGNATVCICITGGGTTPHYRIDFSPELPSGEQLHGTFGAFDGTNHKPITSIEETTAGERENVPLAEHWSTRSMTINDVRSLLRQIRGFKRGRT